MATKKRRASSKGFSEDDLEAILATLPASPDLAPPDEIRQWLREWHSRYSDLEGFKLKNMAEGTRLSEAHSALVAVRSALLSASSKFIELQCENIIDQDRFRSMDNLIDEALNIKRGAFSHENNFPSMSIYQLIDLIAQLEAVFEPPKDWSAKGAPKKIFEADAIRALARIYWRSTKRRPTVTYDSVSDERRGPYFEFVMAVISRVWGEVRLTRLIVEIGREVGT